MAVEDDAATDKPAVDDGAADWAEALLEQKSSGENGGVLSGEAAERITNSVLKELIITDSIQATDAVTDAPNIRHLPIAPLLGEAIRRIADESSVSSLFD